MKTAHPFFNKELFRKICEPVSVFKGVEHESSSNSQIFVSGLTMGNHHTNDQRSFSGWGLFMAEEKKNGQIVEHNQFNNMFNCDPVEAALTGVAEAFSRLKNNHHLELVMQDAYLPIIFANPEFIYHEENIMRELTNKDPAYWRISRRLEIYDRIQKEISKSEDRLASLTIRYAPHGLQSEIIHGKQVFSDRDGLDIANTAAYEGFRKAVRGGFFYLVNFEGKKDLGSSIITIRKNLNNSYASTKEFLLFLANYSDLDNKGHLVQKVLRRELNPILSQLRNIDDLTKQHEFIESNRKFILGVLNMSDDYAIKELEAGKKGFVLDVEFA